MSIQTDFVTILSDHINKRPSEITLTEELHSYARKHKTTGIFYIQTLPVEEARRYSMQYSIQLLQRQFLEQEIRTTLIEAGIEFFFAKGTAIAAYYPIPSLRTMSDSDIVVKDRDAARAALEAKGYEFYKVETSDWHFRKNEVYFELHSQLLYGTLLNSEQHLNYFNDCWKYVKDNQLDWNFHFLFLLEHLRKHLVWEGVGFRQFMDIAVMVKYGSQLFDWNWIEEQLKEIRMFAFAQTCFGLIREWYGIEPPFDCPELSEEFCTSATAKILENGVFGRDSEKYESEIEREIYVTESSDGSYGMTVIRRFCSRLFPKYEELIAWEQYRGLTGRKYLLPVFWAYRLFRSLFQLDKWKKNQRWSYLSKEQYEKYNNELKQWGL